MRTALTICREYGQPPAWWDGLDIATQALLVADLTDRRSKGAGHGR